MPNFDRARLAACIGGKLPRRFGGVMEALESKRSLDKGWGAVMAQTLFLLSALLSRIVQKPQLQFETLWRGDAVPRSYGFAIAIGIAKFSPPAWM
jgi:hypothetical protein